MDTTAEVSDAPDDVRRAADMLGVSRAFKRGRGSPIAIHEIVHAGLPRRALFRAMQSGRIPQSDLLAVFAISTRTLMRLKADPDKPLAPEQSGRLWQFAEIFAKAVDVLGSTDRAVDWMLKPAMALENRRPIELLTTPTGARLVDDVIERMRYGVYQ
jgi:putative toxin-antitoxin system antitoxin component (TIGR02293 family)